MPSSILPPNLQTTLRSPLLRLQPRQRLNTLHHIPKHLLILPRRITLRLRPLNLLPIIPLHLKSSHIQPRIQPINVFIRIARQPCQRTDQIHEFVAVFRVDGAFFDDEGLVLSADVRGVFDGGGAVGFADDFDFGGGGCGEGFCEADGEFARRRGGHGARHFRWVVRWVVGMGSGLG